MKKLKLGVVGATGLVGQTFLKLLQEENLLSKIDIVLICSEKSAGKRILFNGNECKLFLLSEECLNMKLDVVVMSAGDAVSKKWGKKFIEAGAIVVDNTNAFRHETNVPLIVPEINGTLANEQNLISNPNCSTIQLAIVLNEIQKTSEIETVVVSTYQSVSGAGKQALLDLQQHRKEFFKFGINKNIIPQIGDVSQNGSCAEENKIMFELNKILNTNLNVCAMTVRVPIPNCHGEAVYVKFKNNVTLNNVEQMFENKKHIVYLKDDVALPVHCVGTNKTFVCRLKQCSENEIMFFVLADNLRRGAAFNAVEIVKLVKPEICVHSNQKSW